MEQSPKTFSKYSYFVRIAWSYMVIRISSSCIKWVSNSVCNDDIIHPTDFIFKFFINIMFIKVIETFLMIIQCIQGRSRVLAIDIHCNQWKHGRLHLFV